MHGVGELKSVVSGRADRRLQYTYTAHRLHLTSQTLHACARVWSCV